MNVTAARVEPLKAEFNIGFKAVMPAKAGIQ
jgi:hypothetical protein